MRLAAVGALVVALAAGCGGGSKSATTASTPTTATLTRVVSGASSVVFTFDSPPLKVRAGPVPPRTIAECGSGARVRLHGSRAVVVHFTPAITHGVPRRIAGPLELVKVCDFEADVAWAISLDRKQPFHVSRDGSTVTVSFDR